MAMALKQHAGLKHGQTPSNSLGNLKSRRARVAATHRSRTSVKTFASSEYESLRGLQVLKASNGEPVELLSLWQPSPGTKVVLPFLTHFADLSSWEYAQKLIKVIPTLEASGVSVYSVGLGNTNNAREFCRILNFPADKLYADPDGACYKALNFSPGFGESIEVSPYLKLLPMLMGIGSPGTLQEVIRGYIGDRDNKPVFESPNPFDVLGTGYQRPFELATLRLFNMIGILPKWSELCPPNTALLTQQGGTVVFDGTSTVFRHDDSGILKYTDVDALLRAALTAEVTPMGPTVPAVYQD